MHSNPYLKALRALWIVLLIIAAFGYLTGLGQISGSYLSPGTGNGTFLFANVMASVGFVLFLAWSVVAASRWTPDESESVVDPVADPVAVSDDVPPQGLEP